ncbi:MAG TPA: hypothetical protein VEA40_08155 [Ramlibacter sp.]|nr:hypothetical protein [Ramlibacter sp.]
MSLEFIQQQLTALRGGELPAAEFTQQVRAAAANLSLPARHRDALDRLLDSLESSALFEGESCSFSRDDLLQALQQWIDASARTLQRQHGG